MQIGGREFLTEGRTYVMGILNVTPDSFSDGGQWNDKDRALYHVETMLSQGMDILDIGGESTRPGSTALSAGEEMERVLPVLWAIKSRFDVPVSLDTYKSEVAREGIAAGADLINDVWGLKGDTKMAEVIAHSGLPCCLMHNREHAAYSAFFQELLGDLKESAALAEKSGIAREKIILDPGVGLPKNYGQNLEILRRLEQLRELGYPILLGCSRKSVIGQALQLPKDRREEGTIVTTTLAVLKGCMFVRVHDVEKNVRAVRMAEAILYGGL